MISLLTLAGSRLRHDLCELYGTGEPAVGEGQRHGNKTKVESEHGDPHCCRYKR